MVPSDNGFRLISDSLQKKPLPPNPQTQADIQHVLEHGYVIIPDCFTKEEAKEARDEIRRLLGSAPAGGRNPFEGLNTNRIYSLLNKSRVFDKFVVLPRVLALNDYFLDPGYLLSAFHTITINGGEQKQSLHHDDGYIQVPRPRAPFGAAIMVRSIRHQIRSALTLSQVALSEYTAANGATRVIPGSHLWDSEKARQPDEEATVPALVPEGGVCYGESSCLVHILCPSIFSWYTRHMSCRILTVHVVSFP